MDIFVGNIAFKAVEDDVRKAFEAYGTVESVKIITEKNSTKSRGFGFVVMSDDEQARLAITALDGKELLGRPLKVSTAKSKPSLPREKKEIPVPKQESVEVTDQSFPEEDSDSEIRPVSQPRGERYGGYKQGRRSRQYLKRRAVIEARRKPGIYPAGESKKKPGPIRTTRQKEDSKVTSWKKSGRNKGSGQGSKSDFTSRPEKKAPASSWKQKSSSRFSMRRKKRTPR